MAAHRLVQLGDIIVYEGMEYEVADMRGSRLTLTGHNHFDRRSVLASHLINNIELVGRVPYEAPPEMSLADAGITGAEAHDAAVWHDIVCLLEGGRPAYASPEEPPLDEFDPALTKATRVANAITYLRERGISASERTVYNMCRRYAVDPCVLSLVDRRKRKRTTPYGEASTLELEKLRAVVEAHRSRADITDKHMLAEMRDLVRAKEPDFSFSHYSTQSKWLQRMKEEVGFGKTARGRRSASSRPADGFGVIRASRPGEAVHADSTKIACFALNERNERQRYELSILVDVHSTAVPAFALAPTTTALTIVRLLARASFPRALRPFAPAAAEHAEEYVGADSEVPHWHELSEGALDPPPFFAIDTLVVDNGKAYTADLTSRVAEQFGCGIRYARRYTPEDKGKVEKALKDIETRLVQILPGFTGASVEHRGEIRDSDLLPHVVLVQLLSDFFDDVWANTQSRALNDPYAHKEHLSPNQVLLTATAIAPSIPIPDIADLYVRHLESNFRVIQHYGIDHAGMGFDSAELSPLYRQPSGDALHDNKFLVKWDPDYPTVLWVMDPFAKAWIVCPWKRLGDYERPFAREMLRGASARTDELIADDVRAARDLVESYDRYRLPSAKSEPRGGRSKRKPAPPAQRPRRRRAPTSADEDVRLVSNDEEIDL